MQTPTTDTQLIELNGWTLRVRHAERPKRLLLLLHGWTGNEDSMWVFARKLSNDYEMLAPRAPHPTETSGYSWRTQKTETDGWSKIDKYRASADALIELMDAYAAFHGIDAGEFDALGFSQGGAMTNVLSLFYPQRIRKAGILSGFIPLSAEEIAAEKPLVGKKFFAAHGTQDELVPIEMARHAVSLLEQAGAQIIYCEDEVGHKLSAKCSSAMQAYFED